MDCSWTTKQPRIYKDLLESPKSILAQNAIDVLPVSLEDAHAALPYLIGLLLPLARAVTKSLGSVGAEVDISTEQEGEDSFWACNMLGYLAMPDSFAEQFLWLRGHHQIQMCHKPVKTDCAAAQQVHHKASRSDWLHSVMSCVLLTIFCLSFLIQPDLSTERSWAKLGRSTGQNCTQKLRSYRRYSTTHDTHTQSV